MKSLQDLAELACGELPEAWALVIGLEAGSAEVTLYDPLGERCENANFGGDPLEEQVMMAIAFAKANKEEYK